MFNPKRKGFFPVLLVKIQNGLTEEEKNEFAGLGSNAERVKFVLQLERVASRHEDDLFKVIQYI